jgi:hypothetical protein
MSDRSVQRRIEETVCELDSMLADVIDEAAPRATGGLQQADPKRVAFERLRENAAEICDELRGAHMAAIQIRSAPFARRGMRQVADLLRCIGRDAEQRAPDAA